MNATENITLEGSSEHTGTGILVNNLTITATKALDLNGFSMAGTALNVTGTTNTLSAASAVITGNSKTGATGFSLNNITLSGGIASGANVNLNSTLSG
ncbi:hypothetical protein DLN99_23285 [Salmonella enterica]|nr:hypothetical protein [Salmonella enterica]